MGKIPENYEIKVLESILVFKHALVYNPIEKCLETLNPLEEDMELGLIIGE